MAMDRGVNAIENFKLDGDATAGALSAKRIHKEVCREGFREDLNSFVNTMAPAKPTQVCLTLLPWLSGRQDPRMRGTVAYVERTLLEDGFVLRYPTQPGVDGLPAGEGKFLLCTFWYADSLFLEGRKSEAREVLERLLALRNDVGLLSEEYDTKQKRLLGNFPQAFSHVGLINTIRNLTGAGGPAEDRRQASKAPKVSDGASRGL